MIGLLILVAIFVCGFYCGQRRGARKKWTINTSNADYAQGFAHGKEIGRIEAQNEERRQREFHDKYWAHEMRRFVWEADVRRRTPDFPCASTDPWGLVAKGKI